MNDFIRVRREILIKLLQNEDAKECQECAVGSIPEWDELGQLVLETASEADNVVDRDSEIVELRAALVAAEGERDAAKDELYAQQYLVERVETMRLLVEQTSTERDVAQAALVTARRDALEEAANYLQYTFEAMPPYEGNFKGLHDEALALNVKSQCIDAIRALAAPAKGETVHLTLTEQRTLHSALRNSVEIIDAQPSPPVDRDALVTLTTAEADCDEAQRIARENEEKGRLAVSAGIGLVEQIEALTADIEHYKFQVQLLEDDGAESKRITTLISKECDAVQADLATARRELDWLSNAMATQVFTTEPNSEARKKAQQALNDYESGKFRERDRLAPSPEGEHSNASLPHDLVVWIDRRLRQAGYGESEPCQQINKILGETQFGAPTKTVDRDTLIKLAEDWIKIAASEDEFATTTDIRLRAVAQVRRSLASSLLAALGVHGRV